jgi:murein DD-endopeptidase MepM/ murein hydrolase activator NlpD
MTILMILLFIEYRFFCKQAREMVALKQQYAEYVDLLNQRLFSDDPSSARPELVEGYLGALDDNLDIESGEELLDVTDESSISMDEILAAEASDAPDDDDDYVDDSFVVINRQPEYLKQSTFDYMQAQELNSLMTAIDVDRWSDYTESSFQPVKVLPTKKSNVQNKRVAKPVSKPKAHITVQRSFKDCGFILPIDAGKFWLSSLFGPRKRVDGTWGFHHGIDMAAVKGTPVKVARAGTVVEAGFQTGYGNTIVVQHSDTLKTRYAHLHTIRVYMGQKIKQGIIVGTVGETGFIRKKGKDGSHLHFEVYEKGKRVNPMHCLPRAV